MCADLGHERAWQVVKVLLTMLTLHPLLPAGRDSITEPLTGCTACSTGDSADTSA